jgi:hypothetical protein
MQSGLGPRTIARGRPQPCACRLGSVNKGACAQARPLGVGLPYPIPIRILADCPLTTSVEFRKVCVKVEGGDAWGAWENLA